MSQAIVTMYAQEYSSSIELLLQQRGSLLEGTVTNGTITGAKAATLCDQIGPVIAKRRTTRYPALAPDDTPHDRPWVYPVDYDWNDLIDSIDKLRIVADPQGPYALNGTYAMGRAKDDEILTNFFADRKTGETAGTTKSFPAGNQIAVNFGAAGNVGLTVAKLREAKRMLMAAFVDLDHDPLTAVIKAKQHDNLLAEIQVISLDFNDKPVMVEGRVTRFLGIDLKTCERVQADATPYDRIPVYAKSGMHLRTWAGVATDISQRKDLAGLPWQIYVTGTFGAVRSEEGKVYEIKCA